MVLLCSLGVVIVIAILVIVIAVISLKPKSVNEFSDEEITDGVESTKIPRR